MAGMRCRYCPGPSETFEGTEEAPGAEVDVSPRPCARRFHLPKHMPNRDRKACIYIYIHMYTCSERVWIENKHTRRESATCMYMQVQCAQQLFVPGLVSVYIYIYIERVYIYIYTFIYTFSLWSSKNPGSLEKTRRYSGGSPHGSHRLPQAESKDQNKEYFSQNP